MVASLLKGAMTFLCHTIPNILIFLFLPMKQGNHSRKRQTANSQIHYRKEQYSDLQFK